MHFLKEIFQIFIKFSLILHLLLSLYKKYRKIYTFNVYMYTLILYKMPNRQNFLFKNFYKEWLKISLVNNIEVHIFKH